MTTRAPARPGAEPSQSPRLPRTGALVATVVAALVLGIAGAGLVAARRGDSGPRAIPGADFTVVGTPTAGGHGEEAPRAGAPMVPAGRVVPAPPSRATSTGPSSASSRAKAGDDGEVRGHLSVFDRRHAAVTRLDPALLTAVRSAATDAASDGVEVEVTSGWRSAAHQEALLRAAVAQYGSRQEAARWVATPETSAHVSGDAVDLGPSAATRWLSRHGAGYGLCQIYRNEPWHYELRPRAVHEGCPAMYADPTHDPRMQR